ncbi:MAG: helix-turn-helix domain-containing protein [Pseudonocardiaceae bacterium]
MGAARPHRRPNELGPTGERVRANVRELRRTAGLSTRELSALLDGARRPIAATGVTKIEAGDRRVDADDLVALALVLDTTPNRLLLPGSRFTDQEVALTPTRSMVEAEAWAWANGSMPGLAGDHFEDVGRYLSPLLELVDTARRLSAAIPDGPAPGRLLLLAYLARFGSDDHDGEV